MIVFNFCPKPLNKNNIVKINVQIEDSLSIKDAFLKGIQNFNGQSPEIRLIEKTEKYKIKLAKKSGLPDMDLPCILLFYSSN